MKRRLRLVLVASLLAAVSPLAAQSASPPPALVAGSSAGFVPAEGWQIASAGKVVRAIAPEGDFTLYLVDVGAAADATAATAAAWQAADPAFARKVRLASKEAPHEGWDEIWSTDYETSPDEKLTLVANAYRRGAGWTVLMALGADATVNKRSGQIGAMLETMRPAGLAPEDFAGKPAEPFDAAKREALKAFWRAGMAALDMPGLGYAFIDRTGIVEEGGMGVKTLGRPDPVTAHTRFMIASNTKGMTTLLLARLVDAGKLAWDEPVVKADPAFRLGDPAVLQAIKVRHLICACTGMPRQDLEWIMTGDMNTPAARVFDLLAPMKPTSKFGEVYQYSNLLASAAGYVAGHVAYPGMEVGAAYDKAMQEMVFDPLGMHDTTFDKAAAIAGDHADPHSFDRTGRIAVDTIDKSDSIYFARPAGGAWSSAHDVALYALDELRSGVLPDGEQFVNADTLLARRREGMQTGEATSYGMGLEPTSRWGVPMIHHGGSMPGYKTDWIILPEAGIGVVMLTNGEHGYALTDGTRRRLVELLYGARAEAAATLAAAGAADRAAIAKEASDLKVPPDPAAVAKLADRYASPELGTIAVKHVGGDLVFDFGSFTSHIATRRNEDGTTGFVMVDPTLLGWALTARPEGDRYALVMRDSQHEYVYRPVK